MMLAVIEALICFDIERDQIDVLSLGCGEDPYVVSDLQMIPGGKLAWSDLIFAAMRLQSLPQPIMHDSAWSASGSTHRPTNKP